MTEKNQEPTERILAELARAIAERDAANQRETGAVLVIMAELGVSCDAARETAKSKLYDWNGETPDNIVDAAERRCEKGDER